MRTIIWTIMACLLPLAAQAQVIKADPVIEQKIEKWISKMTLEEK